MQQQATATHMCIFKQAFPLIYFKGRWKGNYWDTHCRSLKHRVECLWEMQGVGGCTQPGGGVLSHTNRHTQSTHQQMRSSSQARLHIFMCQLVITQRGLVFPDCSGLSETLRVTCITHFPDIHLCVCGRMRACVVNKYMCVWPISISASGMTASPSLTSPQDSMTCFLPAAAIFSLPVSRGLYINCDEDKR